MPKPRGKVRRYADGTSVAAERSIAEIRKLLLAHGATAFMVAEGTVEGDSQSKTVIQFQIDGRLVRFEVFRPPSKFGTNPQRDQEWRRRWRVMVIRVKVRLEAIADGDSSVDAEFLPWIVLPDGSQVGHHTSPQLQQTYIDGKMPKLLLPG